MSLNRSLRPASQTDVDTIRSSRFKKLEKQICVNVYESLKSSVSGVR